AVRRTGLGLQNHFDEGEGSHPRPETGPTGSDGGSASGERDRSPKLRNYPGLVQNRRRHAAVGNLGAQPHESASRAKRAHTCRHSQLVSASRLQRGCFHVGGHHGQPLLGLALGRSQLYQARETAAFEANTDWLQQSVSGSLHGPIPFSVWGTTSREFVFPVERTRNVWQTRTLKVRVGC